MTDNWLIGATCCERTKNRLDTFDISVMKQLKGIFPACYAVFQCPCEHGNEPSGHIKTGGFIDQLCDYQLLKK
jgi:hypothetical protein